ncbi:MAG: general secretion pathway protein GspB [Gammaproteobacteria bacterium]
MSYILDALRRSEQERRPRGALAITRRDPGPATLPPRRLIWLAAPIVGVLALLAGAYVLFVRPSGIPPETNASASVDAAPAMAPSAPMPHETPVPKAAAAAPAPPKQAAAPVRDLVEQTRIAPKPAPRPTARDPGSTSTAVSAPASPFPARPGDDVRLLRVMPPDFQRALPEMVVNIHVYAATEAERILYINNRQYHAGDKVRDDIIVEEIVEDGAVLNYRGQRFKLPRPS